MVVGALPEMPERWVRKSGFVVRWELDHADTVLPGRSTRTVYLVQQGCGAGPARDALAMDMGDVGNVGNVGNVGECDCCRLRCALRRNCAIGERCWDRRS